MNPWNLVILLCLVDGLLCHELLKGRDERDTYRQRHPYIAQVFYILKNRAKGLLWGLLNKR